MVPAEREPSASLWIWVSGPLDAERETARHYLILPTVRGFAVPGVADDDVGGGVERAGPRAGIPGPSSKPSAAASAHGWRGTR